MEAPLPHLSEQNELRRRLVEVLQKYPSLGLYDGEAHSYIRRSLRLITVYEIYD